MTITINGVDQTSKVILRTFRIEQILTQEADTCRFSLLSPTTVPVVLNEVIVSDGVSNIFAGVVLNVVVKYQSNQAVYEVICKDYTELLDGKYVVQDYGNIPLVPKAYYKFSGNANDTSGYGNNGTVHGATLTPDKFGTADSAYSFSGSSQYIDCGSGSSLEINGDITIMCRVFVTTFAEYNFIIAKQTTNSTSGQFEFRINQTTGRLTFLRASASAYQAASSNNDQTGVVPLNEWVDLAVKQEGTTVTFYINGVACGGGQITLTPNGSAPCLIGTRSDFYKYFNGKIDEVAVFDSALSDSSIAELVRRQVTEDINYITLSDLYYTVEDIIQDIIDTYLPAGFTLSCAVDQTISYIKFNYEKPSSCFKKMADLLLADWYVDYSKVIHFISKSTFSSPFSITDDNNKAIKSALILKQDASQIKNTVYVRGGEYLGSSYTETFSADGSQTTFNMAYKYSGISITVAGASKTVGVDNINDPTTVDCLYNFAEKAIKFPSASKPTAGQAVAITGLPYIPVYVKAEETSSITKYGVKEFKIIDPNIKSKQGAIDRAKAELQAYNETLNDGNFSTYETGLRTGQQIYIDSATLGTAANFIINRLTVVAESSDLLRYDVTLTTIENFDLLQLLQQLLDRTEIGEEKTDEVLEKLYNVLESVTIGEDIAIVTAADGAETMTVGESIRRDPFVIQYALTPYTVIDENDPKRPFLLDYGLLS